MIPGVPAFLAGKVSRSGADLLRQIYVAGSMVVPRLTGAPFQLMEVRLIEAPMADDFDRRRGYRIVITELGREVGKLMAEMEAAVG